MKCKVTQIMVVADAGCFFQNARSLQGDAVFCLGLVFVRMSLFDGRVCVEHEICIIRHTGMSVGKEVGNAAGWVVGVSHGNSRRRYLCSR
jgi:hypothetical protein